MKVDKKIRRLNAIKVKFPMLLSCECKSCHNEYLHEKMFIVDRWGVNNTIHSHSYCKQCMPTKEDVLFEIDTDENPFGIAFVDNPNISKDDCTRLTAIFERYK